MTVSSLLAVVGSWREAGTTGFVQAWINANLKAGRAHKLSNLTLEAINAKRESDSRKVCSMCADDSSVVISKGESEAAVYLASVLIDKR